MRRFLFGPFLLLLILGCGDDGPRWGTSEIVFGVRQATNASGEKEVSAGYDYLRLANKGGWTPSVFRDGDGEGTCYFERFDQRLGRPRVDSGAATFRGGRLPPSGLQVLANQPDLTVHPGAGWEDGDTLVFDVSGFAMPRIHPAALLAPRGSLDVKEVTPAAPEGTTELTIKASDSVGVTWAPVTEGPPSRVMVSLETEEPDGRGSQLRCFSSIGSGSSLLPSHWVARLFSAVDPATPVKGRLEVASHRQLTILAQGGWIVYVVATTLHREQPFTGAR